MEIVKMDNIVHMHMDLKISDSFNIHINIIRNKI